MNAPSQALQKKPAARSSTNPDARYFKVGHEWVELMAWIGSSGCEYHILLKLFSLQNKRAAQLESQEREPSGFTGLVDTADLAADSPWSERRIQETLDRLTSPEFGAIEAVKRREALEKGLITAREAGEPRIAYVYRVCLENWAAIAERAKAEAMTAPEPEPEPAAPAVVHIVGDDRPVVHLPGKNRTVELVPEVRRALARVTRFESDFHASVPLGFSFRIEGDVFRYAVADAAAESAKSTTRKTAFSRNKGLSSENGGSNGRNGANGHGATITQTDKPLDAAELAWCELLDPIFRKQWRRTLTGDASLLRLLEAERGEMPFPYLYLAVAERAKRKVSGAPVVWVSIVAEIRRAWDQERGSTVQEQELRRRRELARLKALLTDSDEDTRRYAAERLERLAEATS